MRLPKRLRGFTLIELLVVISIIAILMAVATVSYTQVQKRVRDQKRKTDLAAISTALQRFYQDNGAYPSEGWAQGTGPAGDFDVLTCHTGGTGTHTTGRVFTGDAFICNGNTYLSKMPGDPNGGLGYYYEVYDADGSWCPGPSISRCQKYTLWAKLESSSYVVGDGYPSDAQCDFAYDAVEQDTIDDNPPDGLGLNYCIHQP